MTKYLIIIVLAFLTAGKIPLRAETPPPKKKTIAVMKIRANNCPAPLAMAVQDMLAGKIFKINFFSLLERSQVGQIINENNFDEDKCDDSECAVKLGQILSADKIVMGSISKLNTYRIEIRVINIADRKVDISIPAEVEREKDFEETVAKIVQDIKHYYQGYSSISGAFDLSLAGTFIAGIGDLTNGAQYGYGASLDFFINKPLGWKFPVIIGTGFYSFVPEIISIDSMYMVPLKAGAAYPISITENVRFYPSITMGYLFTIMTYDRVEYRALGDYQYSTELFYNPLVSIKTEVNILLFHRWFLTASPEYTIFFESGRVGHLLGINLGVRGLL